MGCTEMLGCNGHFFIIRRLNVENPIGIGAETIYHDCFGALLSIFDDFQDSFPAFPSFPTRMSQ